MDFTFNDHGESSLPLVSFWFEVCHLLKLLYLLTSICLEYCFFYLLRQCLLLILRCFLEAVNIDLIFFSSLVLVCSSLFGNIKHSYYYWNICIKFFHFVAFMMFTWASFEKVIWNWSFYPWTLLGMINLPLSQWYLFKYPW